MTMFIIKRLISILITFFIVSVIIFLMMHAVPGGPFDGNDMPVSEAVRAKLMASLGLDKPLHVQYLNYMWGVMQLDFGVPFQSPGETVLELLARAWPPSLLLGGMGMLIGVPLGILLGMAAALRRNSWIDYLASAVATLGLTIPVFVISMILILVFAVWLQWLPAKGWGTPQSWILPIAAYAMIPMATYARYTRSAMLDTLNKPRVCQNGGSSSNTCCAIQPSPWSPYSCRCLWALRQVQYLLKPCSACRGLALILYRLYAIVTTHWKCH
jgi:ABC-type dipeptide/oligopeptide/nickel transport system permease component